MATVYLAEDLKHGRKVAIKVLHPELSAVIGGERFLSEIKTTASLQHPHILGLIDSGEADGLLYYVMPFIEGETLRARLQREKQLPVEDALRLTREVASALEFAHKRGIVHRDIKPENILLQDGQALVADFGIALAVQQAGGSRMTQTGMSLGTPAYMSPEQAMGEREIGARSDVYALGAMAYEMLAGEPPFTGPNSQAIVAKVLTEQPPSLRSRRPLVPAAVETALLTALQKLPADRFGSAREFAAALSDGRTAGRQDDTYASTVAMPAAARPVPSWRRAVVPSLVGLCALSAATAVYLLTRQASPAPISRYQLHLPGVIRPNLRYSGPIFALSPDGRRVAYVRLGEGGARSLWVMEQPAMQARELVGTDGADTPFFSPDGNHVAFFARGRLLRMPFEGGTPVALADSMSADLTSGTWRSDGTILATGVRYDVRQVPENGGPARSLTPPSDVTGWVFPTSLPDDNLVLITECSNNCARMHLKTLDLGTLQVAPVLEGVARAWYLPGGQLFFVRQGGTAMVAPFDLAKRAITGTPRQVLSDVQMNVGITPWIDVRGSQLAYLSSAQSGQQLARGVRVDRTGRSQPLDESWSGVFQYAALSPDGTQLALSIQTEGRFDLWVKQLDAGPLTRLTFDGSINYRPTWSPDGRQVTYISDVGGRALPWRTRVDGSSKPERVVLPDTSQVDEIIPTRNGPWTVYRRGTVNGARRIVMARPGTDTAATVISAGNFDEYGPVLSPDGQWLAYVGTESGREEVYVRPFPDVFRARWQVSTAGGGPPQWSHSGRELFFPNASGELSAVDVATAGGEFRSGPPRVLFSLSSFLLAPYHQSFIVEPGDRTFLLAQPLVSSASQEYAVVLLNWEGRGGR